MLLFILVFINNHNQVIPFPPPIYRMKLRQEDVTITRYFYSLICEQDVKINCKDLLHECYLLVNRFASTFARY